MNHRQRFETALAHKEPDRVPLDLGGSIVTSIAAKAYENLLPALALPPRSVRIGNLYSQTAEMDEDVYAALDTDTRPLHLHDPRGFKMQFFEKDGYHCYVDEWQITCAMPLDGSSGYSVIKHPLAQASTVKDIEDFKWPDGADPGRFDGLEEEAKRLSQDLKVGLIMETNIGGVYEWPGWLRGMENFLMDLAGDPVMAQAVMEKIVDFKVAFWEAALKKVGKYVGMVRESDDLAGQSGLLISRDLYRKFMKPLHARICAAIRKHTHAVICLHSCGSIWDLIPDLMEAGFTGLNPVQVGAAKMDPVALKKEFGKDLVFWGGACDSQQLPYLTVQQVQDQAKRNLDALAPGGGYVYSPINMIQADVPPRNIIALAETLHQYGVY